MKKKLLIVLCVVLTMSLVLAACGGGGGGGGGGQTATDIVGINIQPLVDEGDGAVQPLDTSPGPGGDAPVGVEALLGLISDETADEIRAAGYTAAVSLHTTMLDWSILQEEGIRACLKEFNIECLVVTDAELSVDKQISDLESIIAMNPDLVISFVLDNDALAPVLRKVSEAGIKLSLIDSVPTGFVHPDDYAGMGTADNYANSGSATEKLCEYLDYKGKVVCLDYATSMFHTDLRSKAARDVFGKYDGIEIVTEQKLVGAEDGAAAMESILIANPDIDGIWTCYDALAMGATSAVDSMGSHARVVSIDLGEEIAYNIASGGTVLATGAQHPYDQGVAEALIGVAALAGIPTPAYVLVPGELVTRETMEASWVRVFKTPPPQKILDALKK